VLAVPVIAFVIVESLARRAGRPALVVSLLLTATATASVMSAVPIGARSSSDPSPIAASAFRPVKTPTATATPERVAASPVSAPPEPTRSALTQAAPRDDIAVIAVPPAPTSAPDPPAVVRFRPRDGWTGVSRFAALSVRFTTSMDHATTERAFRAAVGRQRVAGTVRWAEGDTVLVLVPSRALRHGTRVTLSVGPGARSAEGVALSKARSIVFTVRARPTPTAAPPRAPSRPRTTPSDWRWPLLGRITQRFGQTLTQYGRHQGIDIDGDTGDRVRAARAGRVLLAGRADACGGLQVRIDHGNGLETWYRHLSRIDVTRGARIAAGTVIGRVGNTGCSLGSHLHFGVRRDGTFVDPLRYLPPR
jgi:murein DD-endopeptidase MepM/ murein hydrolase activator NlpD